MYTYGQLKKDVAELAARGAKVGIIGRSECGRKIPYIEIGRGGKKIIVTGGIHARENLTSRLVTAQARYALDRLTDGEIYSKSIFACLQGQKCDADKGIIPRPFGRNNTRSAFESGLAPKYYTIYFLPMVNPDGAALMGEGADAFGARRGELIRLNGGSNDFSLWKANAYGVDLNVNFDARWGTGKSNVFVPSSENYVGEFPFCAAETRALRDFTLSVMPDATVSYHAKGRELYWYFHQSGDVAKRDRRIAEFLNEKLGYRLGEQFTDSAGGYKDWCVEKLRIPAFTVEIISDEYSHPLPDGALGDDEINRNIDLPIRLAEYLNDAGRKIHERVHKAGG